MKDLFHSFRKDSKIVGAVLLALALIGVSFFLSNGLVEKNKAIIVSAATSGNGGDTGSGDTKGNTDTGGGKGEIGAGALCGFAWGATDETPIPKNGVGWVSFSSTDCDTNGDGTVSKDEVNAGCPAGKISPYGVSVDDSGNLNGYAWSNNVGWIKFGSGGKGDGGLSGFPKSSGNSQTNAGIDSDGNLFGWARACAGTVRGDCSTMDSRTDGWDGWISLAGQTTGGNSYGVSLDGGLFKNFSWGSDVVGWLKWDSASGNGVRYCSAQVLTAGLTAIPNQGTQSLDTTLTATASYPGDTNPDDYTYRFKCGNGDDWSSFGGDNTYGCSYSNGGTQPIFYNPQVEVRLSSPSLTASASADVTIDPANIPPPPGDLSVSCSVPPQVKINTDMHWLVDVTSGQAPYTYTFDFNDNLPGQPGAPAPEAPVTQDSSHFDHIRNYNRLGSKSMHVDVVDSLGVTSGAGCDTHTSVVVNPIIIPI